MSEITIKDVRDYITKRYDRWLDYSTYHCGCAGIPEDGVDVLNEVLLNLLEKPEEKLIELFSRKSGQYKELDYFILRMIKMNATSVTAPYRYKYHHPGNNMIDKNVNLQTLDILDLQEEDIDRPAEILRKTNIVREAVEDIEPFFEPGDIELFYLRYFDGESYSEWRDRDKCNSPAYYEKTKKVLEEVKIFVQNYKTRKLKVKSYWLKVKA